MSTTDRAAPAEPVEETSSQVVDVVVLGAGPAGLAAGWYAARRGLRVAVVDRASHVGGLATSIEVAGQRVDLGSHRLHPSIDPALLDDLRTLLGDSLQWRERNGRVRLRGRWLRFPFRPLDVLAHADKPFALAVGRDLLTAPLRARRPVDVDTFGAHVRAGLGPAVADGFYEPYARKLWDAAADELSGELFRRRVSARTGASILKRVVRRGPRPGFWYPAGGFGQICDALSEALVAAGAMLLLGEQPAAVHLGAGRTDGVRLTTGRGELLARTVVSTIPAAALTAMTPSAPPEVVTASRALDHRGAVLAYLVIGREQYTPFDAHYFPEPSVRIARLSEPKNYRSSPADPRQHTVLCAELPATVGDELWTMPDEAIARLVAADLRAVGLPEPDVVGVHIERRQHVYPVYRVGFEEHQQRVERWADGKPGLALVGRQALFAHDNTHHALLMGRAVGECLRSDGTLDASAWSAARAAFRDHVVED